MLVGVIGAAVALATVSLVPAAFASVPRPPKVTATVATFTIPVPDTSTWRLQVWHAGTLEGTDKATSGVLAVAVPATSDCRFQADVYVASLTGGTFYYYSGTRAVVPGCGPLSTISGHIDLCSATGVATATEVAGGTLGATGPQVLPAAPNPLAPTPVAPGTYTLTAAAPPGYVLVACGDASVVISGADSASEPVVVPSGGSAVGIFYVVAAASGLGGGSQTSGPTTRPPTSPGRPSPAATLTRARQPAVTPVSGPELALTGMETGRLLFIGLVLMALGALATAVSHVRRHRVGSDEPV